MSKRVDWVYFCESCGREFTYVCKMPKHLLTDIDPIIMPDGRHLARCGGALVLMRVEGAQWTSDDSFMCEHANEAPLRCPCPPYCYCKSRTCARLAKRECLAKISVSTGQVQNRKREKNMFKNNGSQQAQNTSRKLPSLNQGEQRQERGPRQLPSLRGYDPQQQNAGPLSYGEFVVRVQLGKVVDTDKPKAFAVVVEFDVLAVENAEKIDWKDRDGRARTTTVPKVGERRSSWFDMLDKDGWGYGFQEMVGFLQALGADEDHIDEARDALVGEEQACRGDLLRIIRQPKTARDSGNTFTKTYYVPVTEEEAKSYADA